MRLSIATFAVAVALTAALLNADATYKLSGTVTSAGHPVQGAVIDLRVSGAPAPNFVATTAADGAFETTVSAGSVSLFALPPSGSGLSVEGVFNVNVSMDTSMKIVLVPSVAINVTAQSASGIPERVELYSLTTSRSYSAATQDGRATFNVPADVYSVHAAHAGTIYTFGRTTVDARDGAPRSVAVTATSDTAITALLPPKRALIHVSPADANGIATITGDPGACDPLATVAVINQNTYEVALALSGSDGSFSVTMFAPPGSALQVKHDPSGRYLPNMNLFDAPPSDVAIPPGTFIDLPPPPDQFSIASIGTQGSEGPNSQWHEVQVIGSRDRGKWWITGSMPSRNWSAGQSVTLSGRVKVYSKQIAGAELSKVTLIGGVILERLFDADGIEREGAMQFVSSFMTPTGFPVERADSDTTVGFNAPATNMKSVDGHIEGDWSALVQIPATMPAGVYRPYFQAKLTALEPGPRYFDILPTPSGEAIGRNHSFPLVRIGAPKAPRLFWLLALDTLSNGARGTVAVEERAQVGITSHVATNPRTLVVPMRDARSGAPLHYRLEPYVPLVERSFAGIGRTPRIPFRFPSGSLSVRITRPDGSVDDLGSAPFAQSMSHSPTTRSGLQLSGGSAHVSDWMQLTTLDPRFDYAFTQYGLHRIEMRGSIEDIYGNVYQGSGTYEIDVARPIDIETATLPGTPFQTGNLFAPHLVLQPPVPADVTVVITHLPDSDPAKMQRLSISGRANRFGFFSSDASLRFTAPGEYRADVTAVYTDANGIRWVGTMAWGSVVETPSSPIVTHGRRGFDFYDGIQLQWFNVRQARAGGDHVMFPFQSGDIMWMQHNDNAADIPKITLQDPTGNLAQRVRSRAFGAPFEPPSLEDRISLGEIPLFSTAPPDVAHLVPEKATQFGYFYGFAERPGVRIREVITEDVSGNAYWRFAENYHSQLGTGINGDLQNDFKFQFGGAVWRDADFKYYGAYASFFVLLPNNDAIGGRVFPPFQGNGGGPTGGPIMTLKGKPIDMFLHPTGVRAGTVLVQGDKVSFAGYCAPTLASKITIDVTSPSGVVRTIRGQANNIGYFYDPGSDFPAVEAGVWKAKITITFDGRTSAGQVTAPFPTGDVLGSREGEFFFYVVRGDAPPLVVTPMPQFVRPADGPITFTIVPPAGLTDVRLTYTTTMPGFILEEGTTNALAYTFDASRLARDFPNLDLLDADGLAGADTITISFLLSGTDAAGKRQHFARQIVLQGEELQMPEQTAAPAQPRRRAAR